MVRLKLTKHFQERFGERGIDFDHVKQAIKNPDSQKVVFEGRIKATKKIGNKTIEVLYYKEGFKDKQDEYVLITVYYT
jgi:hypothetical protein